MADLNHDRVVDVVLVAHEYGDNPNFRVLASDAGTGYAGWRSRWIRVPNGTFMLQDWDHDGQMDFVVMLPGGEVSVLRGNGDGTFEQDFSR